MGETGDLTFRNHRPKMAGHNTLMVFFSPETGKGAQLISFAEGVLTNLEEVLRELGAGDHRFKGTSFGRGECDLPTFLQECRQSETGRDLPADKVPQTTYWLVDDRQRVIGLVRVRHRLNAQLLQYGGHIGYYVRPSERGKGYGRSALRLALERLSRLGVDRALLTVNPLNTLSRRVVLANGGVPDQPGADPVSGEIVDRYWIELGRPMMDQEK